MNIKKRLVYIDISKGLGMSMIVWMHIWGNNSVGFAPPMIINNFILTIFVPLFFVLSGYLLSYENFNFTNAIRKKTRTILRPFAVVYLFSFIISYLLSNIGFEAKHGFEWSNFLSPVFSKTFFNGPIWFLLALFWAFFFFYSIIKICKAKEIYIMILAIGVGCIGFYLKRISITLPLFMGQGMVACSFLLMGSLIRKYVSNIIINNKWKCLVVMIVGLIFNLKFRSTLDVQAYVFTGYFIVFFISVTGGSMAFICFSLLTEKYMVPFAYWGKYSLIVLCLHNFVLIPSAKITGLFLHDSYLWAFTNFIIIYLAFLVIIPLVGKFCPSLFNIKTKK